MSTKTPKGYEVSSLVDFADLPGSLSRLVTAYRETVERMGGESIPTAQYEATVRKTLAEDTDCQNKAVTFLSENVLPVVETFLAENPSCASALFDAFSLVTDFVKNERDYFVKTAAVATKPKPVSSMTDAERETAKTFLAEVSKNATSIFTLLSSMGQVPDGIATKTTKTNGTVLDLPRIPGGPKIGGGRALSRFVRFNLDGTEMPEGTLALDVARLISVPGNLISARDLIENTHARNVKPGNVGTAYSVNGHIVVPFLPSDAPEDESGEDGDDDE